LKLSAAKKEKWGLDAGIEEKEASMRQRGGGHTGMSRVGKGGARPLQGKQRSLRPSCGIQEKKRPNKKDQLCRPIGRTANGKKDPTEKKEREGQRCGLAPVQERKGKVITGLK